MREPAAIDPVGERLEGLLAADLAYETHPSEEDEQRLAGLVAAAVAVPVIGVGTAAGVRGLTGWLKVLGLFVLTGGAALALLSSGQEGDEGQPVASSHQEENVGVQAAPAEAPKTVRPEDPPEVAPAGPREPTDERSEPLPDPEASTTDATATPQRENAPGPSARTAAELLAAANEARAGRRHAQAIALYEELGRRYPDSRESLSSRVSLGRLLLAEGKKPRRALAVFEAYLRASPDGTLAQEAMVGRARALQALGDRAQEREAWMALLERFPDTIHRARAEARLQSE